MVVVARLECIAIVETPDITQVKIRNRMGEHSHNADS